MLFRRSMIVWPLFVGLVTRDKSWFAWSQRNAKTGARTFLVARIDSMPKRRPRAVTRQGHPLFSPGFRSGIKTPPKGGVLLQASSIGFIAHAPSSLSGQMTCLGGLVVLFQERGQVQFLARSLAGLTSPAWHGAVASKLAPAGGSWTASWSRLPSLLQVLPVRCRVATCVSRGSLRSAVIATRAGK